MKNYKDPFNAGQMIGMLVALTFVEKNNPPVEFIEQLKNVATDNAQEYLDKPAEDIYLMIEKMVNQIKL